MITRFFVLVVLLGLPACDGSGKETTAPVHDVKYYLDHPEARKAMRSACENDPGRLHDTASCKNAGEADRKSFIQDLKESLKPQ